MANFKILKFPAKCPFPEKSSLIVEIIRIRGKSVLCSAFGYTRFSVYALFGRGAFGYTRLWVVTPNWVGQECSF
jgi:hypothetical protein